MVLSDGVFREAIRIASPVLHGRLADWLASPSDENIERLALSVFKYFARATSRATPFGLFAASSTGLLGETTSLRLAENGWHRHTRFDSYVVRALGEAAVADMRVWADIPLRHNPSLHRAGDRYHYVERLDAKDNFGSDCEHVLSAADTTPHLESVLSLAAENKTPRQIAATLADSHVSSSDWLDYLRVLVQEQVLISSCDPVVTSGDPIAILLDELAPLELPAARMLAQVHTQLADLDCEELGVSSDKYDELTQRVASAITVGPEQHVFQVDSTRALDEAELGTSVVEELLNGAAILHHLGLARNWFDDFLDPFVERYGRYTRVPLLTALDAEIGIPWKSPSAEEIVPTRAAKEVINSLYFRAVRNNAVEVEVTPAEMNRLSGGNVLPLPRFFSVHGVVVAKSCSDVQTGNFRVIIDNVAGPSGATLLGRFCHNDAQLQSLVSRHTRSEEDSIPDTVFADVVHMPGRHTGGNVTFRSPLRQYAIPLFGRAHPSQQEIPLSDLWLSVCGDELVLWSESLGKRVIPRLETAHNFVHGGSFNAYSFLCLLQPDRAQPVRAWTWGQLESAPFLPRVTFGKVVLRRAQWTASVEDVGGTDGSWVDIQERIARWRDKHGVPERVRLSYGDQSLLIDFGLRISIEAFISELKKGPKVRLVEIYPNDSELIVDGPGGRYFHEVVVPFERVEPNGMARATQIPEVFASSTQVYPPGSEWVFAKLYGGDKSLDNFLISVVRSFADALRHKGLVDRWFFIRYADPDRHVRLRFRQTSSGAAGEVISQIDQILATALASGSAWRVQYDTYIPENGRYGGRLGMAYAESIFSADSDCILGLMREYGPVWGTAKTVLGLFSVLELAADCSLSLNEQRALFAGLRGERDDRIDRERSKAFRALRSSLDSADRSRTGEGEFASLHRHLAQRSRVVRALVPAWIDACRAVGTPIETGIGSIMHMSLNRLGFARRDENDVYDFAVRVVSSRLAREFRRA